MKTLLSLILLLLSAASLAQVQPEVKAGSVVVGTPTGGNTGPGSINAQSVNVNGVAVTGGGVAPPIPLSDLATQAPGTIVNSTNCTGSSLSAVQATATPCVQSLILAPSSISGANANAAYGAASYNLITNAGNLFNDPSISYGYNVNGVTNYTTDPFAAGIIIDGNYETQSNIAGSGGTATSVSSTTLTDTTSGGLSAGWTINQFIGLTLYNVTQGLSAKITANTGTTITANLASWSGTPVYKVLDPLQEISKRFYSEPSASSVNLRTVTLQQDTFDRAFAAQQATLGVNGVIAISNISSSTNALVTTSVNHGLDNTKVIRISGITGGTWTKLNNQQYAVITTTSGGLSCAAADATHFCINTNTTTLTGTPVFTNAVYIAEPAFNGTGGTLMVDANQGLRILAPAWDSDVNSSGDEVAPCGGNLVAQFLQSSFTFCSYGYHEYNKVTIQAGTGQESTLALFYGGAEVVDLNGYNNGSFQLQPLYSGTYTAGTLVLGAINASPGDVALSVGQGYENGGIINANNVGLTTTRPAFWADLASSQTGDIMHVRYGGNSYTCCTYQVTANGMVEGEGFVSYNGAVSQGAVTATVGTISAHIGGPTVGAYTSSTSGTVTVTIVVPAAPVNGWFCSAHDETTAVDYTQQATVSGTTLTVTGTTVSGDVVKWGCLGY